MQGIKRIARLDPRLRGDDEVISLRFLTVV